MDETGTYWDSPAGWHALAQGASPASEAELRFYNEAPERVRAARAFREAHGDSTYTPLSAQEERDLKRAAEEELRRAGSRGLAGGTQYAEGEWLKVAHRMELLALSKEATDKALVTRGQMSPADMDAWRERQQQQGPMRGVPRG
jgi:hypothetical protein